MVSGFSYTVGHTLPFLRIGILHDDGFILRWGTSGEKEAARERRHQNEKKNG
ncbi:MAG: hypothetical protein ACLSBB_12965 [Ruthenibacterium lactatiformans]